ncbi:MAG TPA: HD domain-containing phosphohydrolase [Acidimicrobiia bacterium]|nr:HD domain-containing phosphohydrolase [Acidimicrobiia bacterium]
MERLRLAELCASTSLFTDLGTGQPAEHGLRTCLVAMRLAEALSLGEEAGRETFYVSLLRFLGCTADAHLVAEQAGGDETRFFAGMATVAMGSPREELARLIRLVAQGEPLPRRLLTFARMVADADGEERLLEAHCEVAARLASELGLPAGVVEALSVAYARWDGRGVPRDVAGDQIPISVRVAIVARDIELWERETSVEATAQMLTRRRGRAYDPAIVDAALAIGTETLRRCDDDMWDVVLDLEPTPAVEIAGPAVRPALQAMGDFADLKNPMLTGHSRRVTGLASAAGQVAGLERDEAEILARAALLHDLGMVAVPASFLGATDTTADWERFRLHPLWTQRILTRCAGLEPVGLAAGRHHELLDGSGYPSGVRGGEDEVAGLLACAEFYEEGIAAGRGRPSQDPSMVVEEMVDLAARGAFRSDHVKAVLAAAQAPVPVMEIERPAGLTEREIDVLALLAKGKSNREIAARLKISPKTVGTHVEHVYAKAAVNSRAAATLFAVDNGLVR